MGAYWVWLITILTAASLLLGIANTIWTWMSKGGAAIAAKQEEQDSSLADHRERLIKIEALLPHLPTKDELAKMQITMGEVTTRLDNFGEDVRRLERTIERFERAVLKDT